MKKFSSLVVILCAVLAPLVSIADPFYDGPLPVVGSDTNGRVTVAKATPDIVKTTLTMTSKVTMTATDGSAEGESIKLFDFDKGAFTLLSAVADLSVVTSAGATNTFVMSLGTAACNDAADLTGTEVDVIPSTTLDTTAGTVRTNALDAVLASPANFNGTATAKSLYLNFGIADADMDANVTNTVSGTVTLIMSKPVGNQ